MEKILFIHDGSSRSKKCQAFAASLAAKLNAKLFQAFIHKTQHSQRVKVASGDMVIEPTTSTLPNSFEIEHKLRNEVDISSFDARSLAQLVNKQGIDMIITCAADYSNPWKLNLDCLLNRIQCPLLLIPQNWTIKLLERIVYLTDLRYCRNDITRYVALFANACAAQLSVAHLTKEGMVHIEEKYAHRLFNEQVKWPLKYHKLGFHYTRERDVIKAADVLVKGLQNDVLVMTKSRYHFNQLIGPSLNTGLPYHIMVPLLIFPG